MVPFPQIIRNIRLGNKVHYSVESILTYGYPRLIVILYVRFFGKNSVFLLEPKFVFCFCILAFAILASSALLVQKKYGARSILPKFLIPKGLKTKFKFFIIKDENTSCAICGGDLTELPPDSKSQTKLSEEIDYNRVVLTPCRHKFHANCLDHWMEKKVECPSCNYNLPPIENQWILMSKVDKNNALGSRSDIIFFSFI